jgi:hypothetical protein
MNSRPQKFKNLLEQSSSDQTQWYRARVAEDASEWWRKQSRSLRDLVDSVQRDSRLRENLDEQGLLRLQKARTIDGPQYSPCVKIEIEKRYRPEDRYIHAHRSKRPNLSPHGRFRELENGNHTHAMDFLGIFGPLEIDTSNFVEGTKQFWLDLDDFWAKQRLFVCVSRIWEARDDDRLLREALREIYDYREQLLAADADSAGRGHLAELRLSPYEWKLVGIESGGIDEDVEDEREILQLPWNQTLEELEYWLAWTRREQIRSWAIDFVQRELNRYLVGDRVKWRFVAEKGRDAFRLALGEATSLWELIWEFFARDTWDGVGWRICPHCQRFFYPKRRDQFYCTTEQQALASKRKWAQEQRARQRSKKRGRG